MDWFVYVLPLKQAKTKVISGKYILTFQVSVLGQKIQWKKYLPGPAKDRNFKVNWPKYGLSSPVETWVLYTLLVKKNCAVLLSM